MSRPSAELVRQHCERLKQIVKASGLSFSLETMHLNDFDAIARTAEEHPEEADYRLRLKAQHLKDELILTGERFNELFNGGSDAP